MSRESLFAALKDAVTTAAGDVPASPASNKVAIALAVREAMQAFRKGKPISFPTWRRR